MQVVMAKEDGFELKPQVAFGRPCSQQGLFEETAFQDLDPVAKVVAMYCMQGSQTGELGIQKFCIEQAAGTLKLTYDQVSWALEQAVLAFRWRWDATTGVLWMTDFHRRTKPWTSAALRRGLVKAAALPDSPVLDSFYRHGVPPHRGLEPIWQSIIAPWRGPGEEEYQVESFDDPVSDEPPAETAMTETSSESVGSSSPDNPSPANSNPFRQSSPETMRTLLERKQHVAAQAPSKYPPPNRRHSHGKPRNKGKRKRG